MKVPSGNHAKCLPGQEGVRGSYATAEEAALHYARWCAVPPGAILKEEGIRSRLCRPAHSSRTKEGGAPMPPCCGAFVVMKVEVVVKEEGSDWRLKG